MKRERSDEFGDAIKDTVEPRHVILSWSSTQECLSLSYASSNRIDCIDKNTNI